MEKPIIIEGMNNTAAIQMDVTYDQNIAHAQSVRKGEITNNFILSYNIIEESGTPVGIVRIALISTTGISGTGTVAYITFETEQSAIPTEIKGLILGDLDGNEIFVTNMKEK